MVWFGLIKQSTSSKVKKSLVSLYTSIVYALHIKLE